MDVVQSITINNFPIIGDEHVGIYLGPGNAGFKRIIKSNYIDKTGMIEIINSTIDTTDNLTCISRPRRFGKSYAAQMLCAYYDNTCDSRALFENYEIANSPSYEQHLNKYHVVNIDITNFISEFKKKGEDLKEVPSAIEKSILGEIRALDPIYEQYESLLECLIGLVDKTKTKVIFIIDEWDSMVRETADDQEAQDRYLNLLRGWFKNNNFTPKVVAAAYMTGILPIKKDGTESAISDFNEYSILNPGRFVPYTGFVEEEVARICQDSDISIEEIKKWYDGYSFADKQHIFNPYSVMSAVKMNSCESYWQKTTASESLITYVNMNYDGLQDDIVRLIAGEELEVDVTGFENDTISFRSKDEVLTLLIHLGYLAYSKETGTVRIPNKEVMQEFESLLKKTAGSNRLATLVRNSEKLFESTVAGKEKEVTAAIEAIRNSEYAPAFYNDEQALRYVIKFAYISCVDRYMKIEELPSGRGLADVVYIPKKATSDPALVVELKWDKNSESALNQIKDRNYPEVLKNYGGEIVLVGINYDSKTKRHSCKIERI